MAEQSEEQDKTEAATPFKLERARKKGTVARGMDLGFLAMLVGIAGVAQMFGSDFAAETSEMMRRAFAIGMTHADDPRAASELADTLGRSMLWPVVATGLFIAIFLVLVDIIQLRGIIFSAEPLKPDFSRLNPAKGLKRVFSLRMLKETAKSVLKMAIYAGSTIILIKTILTEDGLRAASGTQLAKVMVEGATSILLLFMALALLFAAIDQIIVRREFSKQMRMSKRELTRENRDREGDPRQRQKRRQIHAEYVKQSSAIANVAGSDVLIVNPEHYAVALSYLPGKMEAPEVRARGRNAFALRMRAEARRLGITIVENPELARALYGKARVGASIPQSSFPAVADIYIMLRRLEDAKGAT